jgi:DNA-binding transcriptional regulator YbjK
VDAIVRAALEVVDAEGLAALTMARVASRRHDDGPLSLRSS